MRSKMSLRSSPPSTADVERFWSRVDKQGPDDCWPWTAGTDDASGRPGTGHGAISIRGKTYRAHVVSFYLDGGVTTPDRPCVLHSCDTPRCCNPAHLRAGTRADNCADRHARGRDARFIGEAHHNSKLNDLSVTVIRMLSRHGASDRRLAHRFDVSRALIRSIRRRESWRHLP